MFTANKLTYDHKCNYANHTKMRTINPFIIMHNMHKFKRIHYNA